MKHGGKIWLGITVEGTRSACAETIAGRRAWSARFAEGICAENICAGTIVPRSSSASATSPTSTPSPTFSHGVTAAFIVEPTVFAPIEPIGIDQSQWVVKNIRVAVPGLGVGAVDGGEASGVGVHPAAELGRVLAELCVVEVGFGVALVAGEFEISTGATGDLFAERKIVEVVAKGEEAGPGRQALRRGEKAATISSDFAT